MSRRIIRGPRFTVRRYRVRRGWRRHPVTRWVVWDTRGRRYVGCHFTDRALAEGEAAERNAGLADEDGAFVKRREAVA